MCHSIPWYVYSHRVKHIKVLAVPSSLNLQNPSQHPLLETDKTPVEGPCEAHRWGIEARSALPDALVVNERHHLQLRHAFFIPESQYVRQPVTWSDMSACDGR